MAWIGGALGAGRRRLAQGSPSRLLVSGALLTLAVTALAAGVGWMVGEISARLGALGLLLEALGLKSMLSLRGLAEAARAVSRDLDRSDLTAARATVGRHLVSRPTAGLDESHVASATIESVAENLTDALVAPLLFYLALGLPGVVAYRVVNTADAMIGYREGALEHFGKVAARLDDLLNLIPARLAAAALVAAAAVTGADARRAFDVMWRDHSRTASPNAGWTMAAMAGALGIVLEKPGHYRLGEGRLPGAGDIPLSVRVMTVAALLTAIVTLAALEIN